MKRYWWKILCVLFLFTAIILGFLVDAPNLSGLNQSIRNMFYHVPMWFNMTLLLSLSFVYAIRYLRGFKEKNDLWSVEFAKVGVFFSVLGMVTGIEWANVTWNRANPGIQLWTSDPKQLCAAISMLTYFAYFVLRGGIKDEEKRGRISAVYNIFAFTLMVPLLFIIPRMVESNHPGGKEGSGNAGNPAFNPKDSEPQIRAIFWIAVVGWFLLGLWITEIKMRMRLLKAGIINSSSY